MKKTTIKERPRNEKIYESARAQGLSHLQADLLCRRNIVESASLQPFYDPRLSEIPAPGLLKNCEAAVERIVRAISAAENIGLVTDYDVDGLASNAVGQRAFGEFFGLAADRLHSFVGNRLEDGYGITERLCDRILASTPPVSLVITADCGVSDEKRLGRLREAGIDVIVTDHHLVPEDDLPHSAYTLVNPQQQDCPYPDKTIAGSMVCWLVMSGVRTRLVEQGLVAPATPTLIGLLDYVALATIADSVSLLSPVNRAVVRYGLLEMNKFVRPCWRVLDFGSQPLTRLSEDELAFQISPRINGAGRMADPQLALDFLLATADEEAGQAFIQLTATNQLRKKIEAEAMELAHELAKETETAKAIVVYHPDCHPGILGILASRLAESYGVPAIVFSNTPVAGILAGSCRTNGATHIRNLLAQAAARERLAGEENIVSFGGHKGAAGIKINEAGLAAFRAHLIAALIEEEGGDDAVNLLETDGALAAEDIHLSTLEELASLGPFGQHFEHPVYANRFMVDSARFVGKDNDHLQLSLSFDKGQYRAIWFRARSKNREAAEAAVAGREIYCVYQLASNEFRGKRSLQLCITEVSLGEIVEAGSL